MGDSGKQTNHYKTGESNHDRRKGTGPREPRKKAFEDQALRESRATCSVARKSAMGWRNAVNSAGLIEGAWQEVKQGRALYVTIGLP